MAKTYRLGPGRRAINFLFTALIQAGRHPVFHLGSGPPG